MITSAKFQELQEELEWLVLAVARGEDTPTIDARVEEIHSLMDNSGWSIDPDSGRVVSLS